MQKSALAFVGVFLQSLDVVAVFWFEGFIQTGESVSLPVKFFTYVRKPRQPPCSIHSTTSRVTSRQGLAEKNHKYNVDQSFDEQHVEREAKVNHRTPQVIHKQNKVRLYWRRTSLWFSSNFIKRDYRQWVSICWSRLWSTQEQYFTDKNEKKRDQKKCQGVFGSNLNRSIGNNDSNQEISTTKNTYKVQLECICWWYRQQNQHQHKRNNFKYNVIIIIVTFLVINIITKRNIKKSFEFLFNYITYSRNDITWIWSIPCPPQYWYRWHY